MVAALTPEPEPVAPAADASPEIPLEPPTLPQVESLVPVATTTPEPPADLSTGPLDADTDLLIPKANRLPLRERMVQYVLLRGKGLTHAEIAERLGIRLATLQTNIRKAVKEGILCFDDASERLEYELTSGIVDNIKEFLGPTADDRHRLKMTIEAAKGIGLFKSHQALKVDSNQGATVLALNIQFQDSNDGIVRQAGNIVGAPRTIDVDAIK